MHIKDGEFVFEYVAFRNFVNLSGESRTVFLLMNVKIRFLSDLAKQ